MPTLQDNLLEPVYNDKGPGGEQLPVERWKAWPIHDEWNERVDRTSPQGLKGSELPLSRGHFYAGENLRIGRVGGAPHMSLAGRGREASIAIATRDFGPNTYLIGGSKYLKGAVTHVKDIGISGPNAHSSPNGVPPCQMHGMQFPGGETVVIRFQTSYFNFGGEISSDHVHVEDYKAANCWAGLVMGFDERAEASHYLAFVNLTEMRRCGWYVRRSNVAGGAEVHSMHLGYESNGIEGEPLLGAPDYYEDNPMGLSGIEFYNFMIERVANVALFFPGRRGPDGQWILNGKEGDTNRTVGRMIEGNDFGAMDFFPYLGLDSPLCVKDLDTGIAGCVQAFASCSLFSNNHIGSASWLINPPNGPGPYIIADGGVGNTCVAANLIGAAKDYKPIFSPMDGRRTAWTSYGLALTDRGAGYNGRVIGVGADMKRKQLLQIGPNGRSVVPHQGTGAPLVGFIDQSGNKGDFLIMWEANEDAAPVDIKVGADETGINGGAAVKSDPSGTGGVVACSASDTLRIGTAHTSPLNRYGQRVTQVTFGN